MPVDCPECGREFDTQSGLNSHRGKTHDTTIDIECSCCSEVFTVVESRKETAKFCSYQCRADWQSENLSGENSHAWTGGKEEYECRWCGDCFEQWSSQRGTEFCDHQCYTEWWRENVPTGEDHPRYVDGRGGYGVGWNDKKKSNVRVRDGCACQECGLSQEEHIEIYGVKLHVHHIVPRRKFESAVEANDGDNLLTLCAPCHMEAENELYSGG